MAPYLVIVESPAKAKKLSEYLWSEYRVEASIGHIRDLPEKNMWIDIANDFTPQYEISPRKKKRVTELKSYAKNAKEIILATDPDREGEAIAWHLSQIFGMDIDQAKRVTYNEITKSAIVSAFQNPSKIDIDLVNAQQSRRILDRIVWYEVSPVLWKKVRPWLSAGRVQSVAVKLIVEREREIRAFVPKETWKLMANLVHTTPLTVELVKINNKKHIFSTQQSIQDFLVSHGVDTKSARISTDKKGNQVLSFDYTSNFTLQKSEKKSSKRRPWAPFITSTLQQEASRKLGYGVKTTMDIAQRLYQNGHITYMRTDSVHLSDTAIKSAQDFIYHEYGVEYTVKGGRQYKTKQSNAQEAHEAIRPTYIDKTPKVMDLDAMEQKLYRLIWERTVASQMKEADIETTTYHFCPVSKDEDWIARGEVIKFPWFMKLYIEGTDDEVDDENTKKLPSLKEGTTLTSDWLVANQKFSLPPARYTEASLVKKLESEEIGRPSTYASIIQTIQDRGYVIIESKKLMPTDIAFVVTDYLEKEFSKFMQYTFTAEVESQFDAIADGTIEWTTMLKDFYDPFHASVDSALETEGRFAGERILWKDEDSGRTVLARMSRYGPVIQIGAPSELSEDEKPRYANLAHGMSIDDIELTEALKLFSFPKEIGEYEEKPLAIWQGRYGPYVKWGDSFVSIPRTEDPHVVTRDRAIELIEAKKIENAPIGYHEDEPYTKGKWRFGPFLKWKNLYVNIPRSIDFDNITTEEAERLIAAKVEKEANRYIHQWPDEKISVENGRYGPFIKFDKKNVHLKREGTKITDLQEIKDLTLEDVKTIISEQIPNAFKAKKSSKKAETTKKSSKK